MFTYGKIINVNGQRYKAVGVVKGGSPIVDWIAGRLGGAKNMGIIFEFKPSDQPLHLQNTCFAF